MGCSLLAPGLETWEDSPDREWDRTEQKQGGSFGSPPQSSLCRLLLPPGTPSAQNSQGAACPWRPAPSASSGLGEAPGERRKPLR